MIFKILGCGTSTGVPVPACTCPVCTSKDPKNARMKPSAILQKDDGSAILFDAGTDLRHQALRFDIRRIDAVLFTHPHADHVFGMDDLRGFNFASRASIPCYGIASTLKEIRRCFTYIFEQTSEYEGGMLPQLELREFTPYEPLSVIGLTVQPFLLWHGKMEVVGFRVGNVAYATDTNRIPEESKKYLRGIDHLVLDGLRYEAHKTHFTIPQAIEMAKELGAKRTYLTHMTHTVDYDEVSKKLPEGIELCYDGMEIEVHV